MRSQREHDRLNLRVSFGVTISKVILGLGRDLRHVVHRPHLQREVSVSSDRPHIGECVHPLSCYLL